MRRCGQDAANWLYHRSNLNFRNIEDLLAEFFARRHERGGFLARGPEHEYLDFAYAAHAFLDENRIVGSDRR